jgi:MOSC domain-containing protein YiiM
MRVEHDIPRCGLSLFQTQLVHIEENSRTGKKKTTLSDGECVLNREGGVGVLGVYGDVVTPGRIAEGDPLHLDPPNRSALGSSAHSAAGALRRAAMRAFSAALPR